MQPVEPGRFSVHIVGSTSLQTQLLVYSAMAFQMIALLAWLFGRWRMARLSGLFAGIFLMGALMAFACGVVFLPASIIGLLVIFLGLAGFAPFITCHVFLRHFLQAKTIAYSEGHIDHARLGLLLGIFLAFAVPGLIYLGCGENIAKIIEHIPWPSKATKIFGPD